MTRVILPLSLLLLLHSSLNSRLGLTRPRGVRSAKKVIIGTATIARLKNADLMCSQAIVAGAIRTRTSLPAPQKTGAQRNAALARNSKATTHVVMSAIGTKRTINLRQRLSAFQALSLLHVPVTNVP